MSRGRRAETGIWAGDAANHERAIGRRPDDGRGSTGNAEVKLALVAETILPLEQKPVSLRRRHAALAPGPRSRRAPVATHAKEAAVAYCGALGSRPRADPDQRDVETGFSRVTCVESNKQINRRRFQRPKFVCVPRTRSGLTSPAEAARLSVRDGLGTVREDPIRDSKLIVVTLDSSTLWLMLFCRSPPLEPEDSWCYRKRSKEIKAKDASGFVRQYDCVG